MTAQANKLENILALLEKKKPAKRKDCLEFQMLYMFFEHDHATTQVEAGAERIKFLKAPAWHVGGKVPGEALYRDDNIKLLRFEMIPAVDIVHMALEKVNCLAKTKYDENVGIRLIPKLIHACERRGIPQNFVPGILLLYLEHCEGCPWRNLLPKLLLEKQAALEAYESLRKKGRNDAKLAPTDWPEYMYSAVADFYIESRRFR